MHRFHGRISNSFFFFKIYERQDDKNKLPMKRSTTHVPLFSRETCTKNYKFSPVFLFFAVKPLVSFFFFFFGCPGPLDLLKLYSIICDRYFVADGRVAALKKVIVFLSFFLSCQSQQ